MKRVLIETRMNSLKLTESKAPRKGCLGQLKGVCADFKNPTRNGRLYPLDLWKKVFNDSLFKESLENKTLYGELDHPEDRFEPLMKYACIVMTGYEIDEDNGLIYGTFDILDTPDGRTLKSIVDYGSVVGVSSRGQGDIVESADGEIVEADSYEFACFDVVSTPAVEKARQSVSESISKKSFKESVQRQISDATSTADLNIIRYVVRTSELSSSDVDSLVESIEDKCKALQEGKTISSDKEDLTESTKNSMSAKTIRDDKKLYSCITDLRKKVSAYKHRETRYIESLNQKEAKVQELKEIIKNLKKSSYASNESVKRYKNAVKKLDEDFEKADKRADLTNQKLKRIIGENSDLKSRVREKEDIINDYKSDSLSKSNEISSLREQLSNSKHEIANLNSRIDDLSKTHSHELRDIDSEVDEYSRLLSEAQSKLESQKDTVSDLKERLNNSSTELREQKLRTEKVEKYLADFKKMYASKCANIYGISEELMTESIAKCKSPEDIEKIATTIRSDLDRHNKFGLTDNKSFSNNMIIEKLSTKPMTDDQYNDGKLESFLSLTLNSL